VHKQPGAEPYMPVITAARSSVGRFAPAVGSCDAGKLRLFGDIIADVVHSLAASPPPPPPMRIPSALAAPLPPEPHASAQVKGACDPALHVTLCFFSPFLHSQ
jgi:hypothetical protein